MPVIAVGAALVADVIAGSAIAATVGGIAAITATTAFEIVAAVGATIGAIGAVTRDKTLSMVGLGIGAIGGIGGLASSAGLFGAADAPLFGVAPSEAASQTTSAFGGAASDASNAATYGSTAASIGADTAAPAMTAAEAASSGTIDYLAGTTSAAMPDAAASAFQTSSEAAADPALALNGSSGTQTNDFGSGFINSMSANPGDQLDFATTSKSATAGNDLGQSELDSLMTGSKVDPLQGGQPPAPPAGGDVNPVTGTVNNMGIDPKTGQLVAMPEEKGFFGGLLDFAKKNPVMAMGILQTGGQFLKGLTDPTTGIPTAQIAAYNAQAAANQAAADMTNQQRANLAMPKAVATTSPVTGAPQPIIPQMAGQGIINRTPGLAPVTGAPA